jgi:patatin-like phospholipase/acyl hydrolase
VLAVDGGGIRGLIPALVLAELERRSARRTHELFDLLVGTSTGGIIALALSAPARAGRPLPAARLVELYEREGPRIFERSIFQRLRSAEGLVDERYSSRALEEALRRYLGDTRLGAALSEAAVTVYDTQGRSPLLLASSGPYPELAMSFAALATSAAPTYFEPVALEPPGAAPLSLIDGGVYAVNPAMVAYARARGRGGEEPLLVSLGTGQLTRPLPHREVRGWGVLEWVRPLIDVVFDGASDAVDLQLRQLLAPGRYFRLQTALIDGASDDLDDASEENLRALRRRAEDLIARHDEQLDTLAAVLPAS